MKTNWKHKPLMWYYHKILCEFYYKFFGSNGKISQKYHKHLHIMTDVYGYNLYGELFRSDDHLESWFWKQRPFRRLFYLGIKYRVNKSGIKYNK